MRSPHNQRIFQFVSPTFEMRRPTRLCSGFFSNFFAIPDHFCMFKRGRHANAFGHPWRAVWCSRACCKPLSFLSSFLYIMTGLQDILSVKLHLWMSIVQKLRHLSQWHLTTMITRCCFLANTPLEAPAHWHASNWLWKSPWGREVDFCRRNFFFPWMIWWLILRAQKMALSSSTSTVLELTKYTLAKKGRMAETCWPGLDDSWWLMMNLAAGPVCASKAVWQNHWSNARAQSLMSETAMLVTAT